MSATLSIQAQQYTVRRGPDGKMLRTVPDSLITPQMHAFRHEWLRDKQSLWGVASIPLYVTAAVSLIGNVCDNRRASNFLGFSCLITALGCSYVSIGFKKDADMELRLSGAGLALTF